METIPLRLSETVIWRFSVKKPCEKIMQNLLENTCDGVIFSNAAGYRPTTLGKKDSIFGVLI